MVVLVNFILIISIWLDLRDLNNWLLYQFDKISSIQYNCTGLNLTNLLSPMID
jgi:hypothetical protein